MVTITIMKVSGKFLGETQVCTRDSVAGTRAVTRDLHRLTRALTRGEQLHFLWLETSVPTLDTLTVGDLVLTLSIENILSEISLRNIGLMKEN